MLEKKIYVLDTSVYLTNADSIFAFKHNDIIVPLKVFEEIDKHKKRQDAVGSQARRIIRIFDELREVGSIRDGVPLCDGCGTVKAASSSNLEKAGLPADLDLNIPDHMIIATALKVKRDNPKKKVILVSRDINMRVIADAVGLPAEDFFNHQVVGNSEEIFTGTQELIIDDETIDAFYNDEEVTVEGEELYPNQYLMLTSGSNPKKTALARYVDHNKPLEKLLVDSSGIWGIHPRNREQTYLMDMLMNPDIQVVSAIGKAGSGKTICAIAAGLQQTLDNDSRYTRLIVSRPVQPLGKDIGYLPGTMEDKMSPWLMPIQDNLQFLMGNDKVTMGMYMDKGVVEIEAITYIRGRSIANAYIIIDEAQNLTIHELKTIITRVGEGTKIILTGDVEQIDNVYIDATTNGLTHAVEKFKNFSLAGHITLMKGERSEVATFAAQNL
jgi:PhoH-like ATPase